jgi:hypothetical protein
MRDPVQVQPSAQKIEIEIAPEMMRAGPRVLANGDYLSPWAADAVVADVFLSQVGCGSANGYCLSDQFAKLTSVPSDFA